MVRRKLGHQCLSAWGAITPVETRLQGLEIIIESPVPFGVGCYHPVVVEGEVVFLPPPSPVPFGVGCYHPRRSKAIRLAKRPCHQCLSAWGAITPTTGRMRAHISSGMSPVPFGVGCYHPIPSRGSVVRHLAGVTSAFRRGVLSPHEFLNGWSGPAITCHQCLSAWGAITPMGSCIQVTKPHQVVTSAFRRGVLSPLKGTADITPGGWWVTSAFRRGVLSPLHPSNSLSFNCPTLPQVTSPFFIGMPSAILAPKTQPTPVTRCKSTTRVQVATCRFLPLLPRYLSAPVTINPNPCRIRPPPVSDSLSDPVSQN